MRAAAVIFPAPTKSLSRGPHPETTAFLVAVAEFPGGGLFAGGVATHLTSFILGFGAGWFSVDEIIALPTHPIPIQSRPCSAIIKLISGSACTKQPLAKLWF